MTPSTASRGLPGWLYLMGALTAIGPFSIDMYLPAFPSIAAGLEVSRGDVERTLAAYLIGLAVSQIVYGPMADRFGRRLPLLVGLLLYIVASLGCALAADVSTLSFWRFVQAMGGAAGVVIPRAVIRDHYDTQQAARALSILMLIMGVAPILAPLIGGQMLIHTSWRGLFWIMLGIGIALFVCVIGFMKESLPPSRQILLRPAVIARNYMQLAQHRRFLCHSLAGGFGQAGMFTYIVGSPRTFIEVFGVSPQHYGLLFGVNALALILGAQVNARLLRRHVPAVLQRRAQIGLLIGGVSATLIAASGQMTLPLLMLCLLIYMSSQGFVAPNSAALALAEQGHRLGAASALLGTLQFSIGAAAGLIISLWQTQSALPLACILGLCATLSWLAGRTARLGS